MKKTVNRRQSIPYFEEPSGDHAAVALGVECAFVPLQESRPAEGADLKAQRLRITIILCLLLSCGAAISCLSLMRLSS